jgi:UDP-N-acetylglucosamine 2-epimerase (non-hydrolysing)
MRPAQVHLIAAARPNFMKVAPVYHALKAKDWCRPVLVHTGQHYDANMSDDFFRDLGLPKPDFHLGIGSGSHAVQTAKVMIAYEQLCLEHRPDWVVVVGDVNSTVACALVAGKLLIPVAHLEAGLRSRDRSMPEELNRIVTDALADLLWTPSPDGDENLRAEGIPADKIVRVGNVMIDAYEMQRAQIEKQGTAQKLGLTAKDYAVVTMHRPSNVDNPEMLALIVKQLCLVAARLPIVFPVHPRTRDRLNRAGLMDTLAGSPGVQCVDPIGYLAFMGLVKDARMIITDSGGVQEETTYLGIPCLTLRTTTERPITVTQGTNRLVAPADLMQAMQKVLDGDWPTGTRPDFWDGHAAERVAESLRVRIQAG